MIFWKITAVNARLTASVKKNPAEHFLFQRKMQSAFYCHE